MSVNIVIIGAGEVGYNLARSLSKNEYEITVVDIDPVKCIRVKENIDALVIEGDGGSQRVLQNIDMSKVDYLLAMTRVDEVNLVASRMARKMGAAHIICRLRNTEYQHKDAIITPKQFGIDFTSNKRLDELSGDEINAIELRYFNKGYKEFKEGLSEVIIESLKPIQGKYQSLMNEIFLLKSTSAF